MLQNLLSIRTRSLKMKSKSKIFFALTIVAIFMLSACQTTEQSQAVDGNETNVESSSDAEPITLRAMIRPDEGGNVAKFAAAFEEETGIKVELDFVGWGEIHDKSITTLASGGGGYDIMFIPSANVVEFVSGGWFAPINEAISDSERGDWLEAVVDMYTVDGDLIAMPWYAGGAHMVYNSEVLDAAGVDPSGIENWDDFIDACQVIQESGAAEYCFSPSAKYPGNFYYNWGTMVLSNGSEFFDDSGAAIFQNSTAAVDSLALIQQGIESGYFNPAGIALDDYETLIEFGTGKTAFLLDSTWAVTQANVNADLSGVIGNASLMLIPGNGDVRSSGYLYAGGLGVLNSSEHKAEAIQFLQFLTSEEAQKHHAIEGANLPTRLALYEDAEIATAWEGFETLAAQLTYGEFPPQFSWFEEWRRSAASAVQSVMSGEKSAQDAMDWLVDETTRIQNQ